MVVKDDFSRFTWLYIFKRNKEVSNAFNMFLIDVRAVSLPSKVKIVRSDNGGEWQGGFSNICRYFRIKQERVISTIEGAGLAARIQAPEILSHVELPPSESLWAEIINWACDVFNHTATTANSNKKSPHEMWHGTAAPAPPHPFLKPACSNGNGNNQTSRSPRGRVASTSDRAIITHVILCVSSCIKIR